MEAIGREGRRPGLVGSSTRGYVRRSRRLLGVVTSVILTVPALGSSASAARLCGNGGAGFAGAQSASNTSVYGARARIEYNNPDLCGSDADGSGGSSAWAMVTDIDWKSASRYGYAQAGYFQNGAASGYRPGIFVFAQWTRKCRSAGSCGTGAQFTTEYFGSVSTTHTYAAYQVASTGRIRMTVDGALIGETNYNVSGDWDPRWEGQFYGEAHDLGSDVPGTAADKTQLDYLQKYNSDGTISFFQYVTGRTTSGTRYHRDVYDSPVGGQGVYVWTDPQ